VCKTKTINNSGSRPVAEGHCVPRGCAYLETKSEQDAACNNDQIINPLLSSGARPSWGRKYVCMTMKDTAFPEVTVGQCVPEEITLYRGCPAKYFNGINGEYDMLDEATDTSGKPDYHTKCGMGEECSVNPTPQPPYNPSMSEDTSNSKVVVGFCKAIAAHQCKFESDCKAKGLLLTTCVSDSTTDQYGTKTWGKCVCSANHSIVATHANDCVGVK